ncbi:hypothetical protein PTKIN_Ptkin14bG0087100 [Pterospermum kingtungense]
MEEKMVDGRQETQPKVSPVKHGWSMKPKFQLRKTRQVNDKKKKDKQMKQIVATQIAELGLEDFPLIFAEIRARNQWLKELNSEIDGYILDKLATWEVEDKLKLLTI